MSDEYNRPSRASPETGCDFLAYSCAAARDFHPLPSSSPDEGARTKEVVKELTDMVGKIYSHRRVKSNIEMEDGLPARLSVALRTSVVGCAQPGLKDSSPRGLRQSHSVCR